VTAPALIIYLILVAILVALWVHAPRKRDEDDKGEGRG
jgi:hypothetical protein